MEDVHSSPDDTRSPCVRAFVANFERRDVSSESGIDNRPPVMTKSKVAHLRQNLGRPSDSAKKLTSDDNPSSSVCGATTHDETESGDTVSSVVSVAKLKENLQKSAKEKRVAPWAFGGAGRPVTEPKKPVQNHNSNAESVDKAKGDDISRRKVNNSFKQAKNNSVQPSIRPGKQNETDVVRNAPIPANRSVSCTSSGDDVATEKPKSVPKVLPKPAIRKTKTGLISSQVERRPEVTANQNHVRDSDVGYDTPPDKAERPVLKNESGGQEIDPRPKSSEPLISSDQNISLTSAEEQGILLRDMNKDESLAADELNVTKACRSKSLPLGRFTDSFGSLSDYDLRSSDHESADVTETCNEIPMQPTETCDIHPKNVPHERARSSNDLSLTDDEKVLSSLYVVNNIGSRSLFDDHVTPGVETGERCDSKESASEGATDLNDEKSVASDNRGSTTDSEPPDDALAESVADSVPVTRESNHNTSAASDNSEIEDTNELNTNPDEFVIASKEAPSLVVDGSFSRYMGSDFLLEIDNLCYITDEELEYESLTAIFSSKMCELEDDNTRWLLCPPENHRSTMDYVNDLFVNELFRCVGERKAGTPMVEESLFLSTDSLREMLLDKATKKSECLRHQIEKVDLLTAKQDLWEEQVSAAVKKKADLRQYSKYCSLTDELTKVTHLLLMLSSRLANVDNLLNQVSFLEHGQQKTQLVTKRDYLVEKYGDARLIKDSIDLRRRQLTGHMTRCLSASELSDCEKLMRTKCQLKLLGQSLGDRKTIADDQIKVLVDLIEKKTNARYC